MPRFQQSVPYGGNKEEMAAKISGFLIENGYNPAVYKNENVFKQGDGLITAEKYFKFSITPEGFFIEAFVMLFMVKESGIKGFTGIVAKRPLKKIVDKIIAMITAG